MLRSLLKLLACVAITALAAAAGAVASRDAPTFYQSLDLPRGRRRPAYSAPCGRCFTC
jgi:hypothetical protein